jgi:hypothetical protein
MARRFFYGLLKSKFSIGTPIACILYLIVFQAAGESIAFVLAPINNYVHLGGLNSNLSTVWRTVFGISALPRTIPFLRTSSGDTNKLPLALIVFYFRLKMLNSALYRKGAIQKNVPYALTLRYYWKSLIGTAGAWFLYDFIVFPNGVFSGVIISSIVKAKGHGTQTPT